MGRGRKTKTVVSKGGPLKTTVRSFLLLGHKEKKHYYIRDKKILLFLLFDEVNS